MTGGGDAPKLPAWPIHAACRAMTNAVLGENGAGAATAAAATAAAATAAAATAAAAEASEGRLLEGLRDAAGRCTLESS
jgi:hypothetical protein